MTTPVIFVAKTPDKQLNNTLETMALAISYLNRLAFEYVNIRSPMTNTVITTPWSQLSPAAGTLYQTTASSAISSNGRYTLIGLSADVYAVCDSGDFEMIMEVRRRSVGASWATATTVCSGVAYANEITSPRTWRATIAIPQFVDTPEVGNWEYGVWLGYSTTVTPVISEIGYTQLSMSLVETR
jgi:hypothetical protein